MPPPIVARALARAERSGFTLACEPEVGALLAVLAASTPQGGRFLELGTGVGVGLAWIVHGLGARRDVEVISVDLDPAVQAIAAEEPWPAFVRLEQGDGAEAVGRLGRFERIFADAPGGKLTGLDRTLAALAPAGVLLVDDMDLSRHEDARLLRLLPRVREQLLAAPDLAVVELAASSGIMLAARTS